VDSVPYPLLLRNLVGSGIEPEISGTVARNSDPLDHRGYYIIYFNKLTIHTLEQHDWTQ
jgi:hypothetical protein